MSMTRDEVLSVLDLSAYRDVEAGLLQFGLEPGTDRLVTGVEGDQFYISDEATESLRKQFDVSQKLAEDRDLFALILNHQSRKQAEKTGKGSKVLIREGSAPQVVGFMNHNALSVLDMDGVLTQVEDNLGGLGTLTYSRAVGNVDHLSFSVVGPKIGEPVVGDTFRWGVSVDYSPTNRRGITVSGFSYRLVCLNGMYDTVQVASVNRRHLPKDVYLWIGEATHQIYQQSQDHFDRLSHLNSTRFTEDHLADTLASIYSEFGVPRSARSAVDSLIMSRGVETPYDVLNAITEVATHHEDFRGDVDLQTRMMRAAGNLSLHDAYCNQCERPLPFE